MDGSGTPEPAPLPRSVWSSVWNAPLVVHVLLLAVVLVGVVAATSPPDSFTTDEGSYELQLRALDRGGWTWDAGTADLDPDGTHYPVAFSTQVEGGWVPLGKHPLWPWAGAQVAKVVGVGHAYDVIGSLAVVVTAVSAWCLAAARDPRLRPSAFWLAGLAPVTVTATFGWAHAASAAASGLAVLGAVRLVDRDRHASPWASVLAGALVAGGVALGISMRSEGLLFAIALAIAVPVGGRRAGRSWGWSGAAGAAVAGIAAITYKAEDLWVRAVVGTGSETLSARSGGGVVASSFLDARIEGATRSLLDVEGRSSAMVLLLAVIGTAIAALYVSWGRRSWVAGWHIGMLVVLLAFVFRVLWMPGLPIRGMLLAGPILVIGLVAAGSALWGALAFEAVVAALYTGAILATQYADGGALQWGGRFFAPLTVPFALVVAFGVARLLVVDDAERRASAQHTRMPLGRILIVSLVVIPMVMGTWLCGHNRAVTTAAFTDLDAAVRGVAITPNAQLPRMMWRYDIPWLVVDEEDGGADLAGVLEAMPGAPDGPETLTLVLRRSDLVELAPALDDTGAWHEAGRRRVGGLTVVTLER